MNIEQLTAILKFIPDGKTTLPTELVIDKMGGSLIVNIRLKLNKNDLTNGSVKSIVCNNEIEQHP